MTISLAKYVVPGIFLAGAAVSFAQSLTRDLPPVCGICRLDHGPGTIGIGSFALQASLLVKSTLPRPSPGDVREEPWVFDLVVTREGTPCMVRRSSGPPGNFADQVAEKVMHWQFKPYMHNGLPICLRSLMFFYVRKENNKVVVRVPGVTEPF